jgi:hypothetical protein
MRVAQNAEIWVMTRTLDRALPMNPGTNMPLLTELEDVFGMATSTNMPPLVGLLIG